MENNNQDQQGSRSCSNTTQEGQRENSTAHELEREERDVNVEPRLFKVFTQENEGNSGSVQIDLPDGYKVLTGGLRVFGEGCAVTACFPVSQFAWRAQVMKLARAATIKLTVVALYDPKDEYCVDIYSSSDMATAASTHHVNHSSSSPSPASAYNISQHLAISLGGISYAACEIPLTGQGETLVGGGASSLGPLVANVGLPEKQCWIAEAMDHAPVTVYAVSLYRRHQKKEEEESSQAVPAGEEGEQTAAAVEEEEEEEREKNITCTMNGKGLWGLNLPGVRGGEMRFSFGASNDKNVLALSYLRSSAPDPALEGGVVANLEKVSILQWQGKRQPMSGGELYDAAAQFCHSSKVRTPTTPGIGSFVTAPSRLGLSPRAGAATPYGGGIGGGAAPPVPRANSFRKPVSSGSFSGTPASTTLKKKASFK